ncbi:hypothetical protein L3X38_031554 [Prunus dulcis]|uniref:Uncharacterized protein n=1 Tax=Prunus dulcis TaxID=3755 RepID=A0AAD4VDV4_PRUDU|nr:hypothetical protein L3X38_031554 [Prunus dulcis]
MDAHGNHLGGHNINDFELQDLIDDANFGQFIDLIRGQNQDPVVWFLVSMSDPSASFLGTLSDPSAPLLTTLPNFDGEMKGGEEDHNGKDSSGTTTTNKRQKVDRSRRRKGRMKERLCALRSLKEIGM